MRVCVFFWDQCIEVLAFVQESSQGRGFTFLGLNISGPLRPSIEKLPVAQRVCVCVFFSDQRIEVLVGLRD